MTQRFFNDTEPLPFAKLSGDFNPIHTDSTSARRFIYGSDVIHGIYLVLWALGEVLKETSSIQSLNVEFLTPVPVGTKVDLIIDQAKPNHFKILLKTDRGTAAKINTVITSELKTPLLNIPSIDYTASKCRTWDKKELSTASGSIDLGFNKGLLQSLLPHVFDKLPHYQTAILLASTRLVGMECPGLRSIYSGLELNFTETSHENLPKLYWHVTKFDHRFSQLDIHLTGPNIQGVLRTFLRPEPVQQPSYAQLLKIIPKNKFLKQRALVIGGSRGLGELSAKILAAGDADVVLSFNEGLEDAQRVTGEIVRGGGAAQFIKLNVLDRAYSLKALLPQDWEPSHLYYFATPPIFVAPKGDFSKPLFNHFSNVYVTGFAQLLATITPLSTSKLNVFYPSSIAVDKPPISMREYAAAKKAGEELCRTLMKDNKNLNIICERLERLPTDQTVSLGPVETHDPVPVLISILESMA